MPALKITEVLSRTERAKRDKPDEKFLVYKLKGEHPDLPEGKVCDLLEFDDKSYEVGQSVEGKVETGTYQGETTYKLTPAGKGRKGGGGGYKKSPEEIAAIQRQHSQHMALLYVGAKAQLGQLPEDFKPKEHVEKIIDWFDDDIEFGIARAMRKRKEKGQRKEQGGSSNEA